MLGASKHDSSSSGSKSFFWGQLMISDWTQGCDFRQVHNDERYLGHDHVISLISTPPHVPATEYGIFVEDEEIHKHHK